MKKTPYILVAMLLLSTMAIGQNLVDGLRYSDQRIQGTARSAAMGNAFGALGGDITSASINPAGLGIYRSSEFVITSQFGETSVEANYLGQSSTDSKYNFSVPSIGYVASFGNENNLGGSLVGFTFGIGYNRLNNFNMKKMVGADNANSTLLDDFVANANTNNWRNFYEELAWQTDLLIQDEESNAYYNDIAEAGYGQSQRRSFTQKGALDEFILSLAANFNHKFYLGATVGIQNVDFTESTSLYENDANNNIPYFNDYTFNTYLNTTGTGFNVKLGALYKPVDALRLGVAIHTPTFYRLHDSFDNSMYSYITFSDGSENFDASSPLGDYDYDLETPMKAIFSAAYIIGKSGILSIDYEYVDYSTIKLSDGGNSYDFYYENEEIKDAYKSVGNLHIGAEYRVSSELSLRAGYEYLPSPINSNFQPGASDPKSSSLSGGLGYRQGSFFLDAAYKHELDNNYAEVFSGSDLANYDITKDQFILTLGFKF